VKLTTLAVLALLGTGCPEPTPAPPVEPVSTDARAPRPEAPEPELAKARLVNLLAGPLGLEARVDGAPLGDAVGFTGVSGWYAVSPWAEAATVAVSANPSPLASRERPVLPPGARATLVAIGSEEAPGLLHLAEDTAEPTAPEMVRLRLVHASSRLGPAVLSVQAGPVLAATPEIGFGEVAGPLEVPAGLWELSVAGGGWNAVLPVPRLVPGARADGFVATTPEGDPFVMWVDQAGPVAITGPAGHVARVHLVNLVAADEALSLAVDGVVDPGQQGVASRHSSAFLTVWPGTRRLAVLDPTGAAAAGPWLEPFPRVAERSVVVFGDGDGGVEAVVLPIPTYAESVAAELEDKALLQMVHAAPSLGVVDVWLEPEYAFDGPRRRIATGLGLGQVLGPWTEAYGSYWVELDVDGDGTIEHRFTDYLPDYAAVRYLAEDAVGRPLLCGESGDTGVWCVLPEGALATLKVAHVAQGLGKASVAVPVFYKDDPEEVGVGFGDVSSEHRLLEGTHSFEIALEGGQTRSVTLDLVGGRRYTLAIHRAEAGGADALLLDDTGPDGTWRLVNLSPALGKVSVAFEVEPGVWSEAGTAAPDGGSVLGSATSGGAPPGRLVATLPGGETRTFELPQACCEKVVNLYLLDEAGWAQVQAQANDYHLEMVSAEEQTARVRMVFAPSSAATLELVPAGGGETLAKVIAKPAGWGQAPGGPVGASGYLPLRAGAVSLEARIGDAVVAHLEVELAPGARRTLLVTGDLAAPEVRILADDPAVTRVAHVAAGLGAVDVWAVGGADPGVIVEALQPGAITDLGDLPEGTTGLGLDDARDGAWDWAVQGVAAGVLWLVTGDPTKGAGLALISDGWVTTWGAGPNGG
jgi:hypothetical protein